MTRRGFTLTELLVTLVVLMVLGTALAQLLMSNSRFVSRQDAEMDARQTARAAMNLMATELRMVGDSGLTSAMTQGISVRMPVGFGVLCASPPSSGTTIASLAPYDSAIYAGGPISGVVWRQLNGIQRPVPGVTAAPSTSTGFCTADSIRVVPGGRLVALSMQNLGAPGRPFYLYRDVWYNFSASLDMPGRIALWRRHGTEPAVEMLAPFASDAGFRFLVGSNLQPVTSALMSQIRGVELRLVAESEGMPPGASDHARFELRPRIKFVNQQWLQ